jgi:hypothetical protein
MTESDPKDLVIAALRQRIGELVSNYESDIAVIRANYTKLKEEFDHISKILADQNPDNLERVKIPGRDEKFIPDKPKSNEE